MGDSLFLTATTPDTDRWLTPRWVLDALGSFDLDPCGAPDWNTADEVWTPETIGDGLALPWHGRVWLNPPYGSAATPWLHRMAGHRSGIALLFARTDTAAWHDLVFPYAAAVLFIRGRLNFVRPGRDDDRRQTGEGNSGAPSALVAYSPEDAAILRDSKIRGHHGLEPPMTDRIDLIEDTLIEHQHIKAGRCTCGFVTRLGASLKRHPAEMVDAALTAAETPIPDHLP